MPLTLKIFSEKREGRIHQTFRSVRDGKKTRNLGTLVLDIGEYQLIGAALLLGAERMQGPLEVVMEGWKPAEKEPE